MKRLLIILAMISLLNVSVSATEFIPPSAPESAQPYMPKDDETFAEGLWFIIKSALHKIKPELKNASGICLSIITITLLVSILNTVTEHSGGVIRLICATAIGLMLFSPSSAMIQLGTDTIHELSEYCKLLLPVMTAAMAAQGGITASSAIYSGTILFIAILTTLIAKIMVPGIYIFLSICIAGAAISQDIFKKLKSFIKWCMTWSLKIVLYIFTGYISISGVVSGTIDASAIKATKLAISGAVPVVGNIISDATESILLSTSIMKNSAGIYGIFAVLAICIGPFIQVGMQYILLKVSGLVCSIFGYKPAGVLIEDFSSGMGFVLAMTGTVCIMLLISLVCFMRGVGL